MVDTCLDKDGDPSTCKDCAKKNSDMKKMPYPNTCTFEGDDFKCVKESIIPFMNGKMDQGDGAFQVHLGDILKGTNAAETVVDVRQLALTLGRSCFNQPRTFC